MNGCPDHPECGCTGKCGRLREKPPNGKVQILAHKLIGTCGVGEVQDELNNLERWECRQLDMIAFACTACGWWFAVSERKTVEDEWFCAECAREGKR